MLRFFTAGESHGKGIFAYLEGIPANFEVDFDFINEELARRQRGYGRGKRMEIEKDRVEFLSGLRLGRTIGSPILMAVWNRDYENWKDVMSPERGRLREEDKVTRPRPGHADLPGILKYGTDDIRDILERSSARETAGRVAVGAVCKDVLRHLGVTVGGYVLSIGKVRVPEDACENLSLSERFENARSSPLGIPVADEDIERAFVEEIDGARERGETLGGIFEVFAEGLPPGIGSHVQWDRRLDGLIARALMSVQAVKGVEIGAGFRLAEIPGSMAHDEIFFSPERGFYRKTNNAGGIEGGMTNGMPVVARAVMKPIPTLRKPLRSVDIKTFTPFSAWVERSDVCAVPSACVVGEAMLAIVILSAILEMFPSDDFKVLKKSWEEYKVRVKFSA